MKGQFNLLLGVFFALIISIFAVINVDPVTVNYLFGQADWPLVLVILFSVLMGGIISASLSVFRTIGLKKQNKVLISEVEALKKRLNDATHQEVDQKDLK
ncbi:lipopolysaccharide assembly protein LapA domain-containing protein [Bacillus sp. REN10]|uniref:LapA family protein n=1 Tax=Bacillus sp. REN10 TaxID=2782541 RepID=UPI00193BBC6A|nr:lipopolysaccharide assembly protein LapA domain-containing protein [Bacillus sp. REN10]